ncbi:MAG: hypothetical protein HQL33_06565 [Alphaproteobacteria bacterium]|nr:hypothetical protein [Alphaproteobacteria bacterium]MBF0129636.1 hypothetical protein [Alphaproteobacteria bacterium]
MRAAVLSWIAIGLWLATAVAVGAMLVRGRTEPTDDGRTAVVLDPGETAFVLGEMQVLLASLQSIVRGLADNDMKAVRAAAVRSGGSVVSSVPASLALKLPMGFRELGRDVHDAFDEIAVAADQGETREMILGHIDRLIGRCIACHSAYQLR